MIEWPGAESVLDRSASMQELQTSIASLNTAVSNILESNAGISCHVKDILAGSAESQSTPSATMDMPGTADKALTITPHDFQTSNPFQRTGSNYESPKITFGFALELERELSASMVYSRTACRHSKSSLPSKTHPFRWSVLSGLGLWQVSDLSVISLPLSADDLWNPQCYRSSQMMNRQSDSLGNSRMPELLKAVEIDDSTPNTPVGDIVENFNYARPKGPRNFSISELIDQFEIAGPERPGDLGISALIDQPEVFFKLGRVCLITLIEIRH